MNGPQDAKPSADSGPGSGSASNAVSLVSGQISFIQRIIDKTLVTQPSWVQAVVLFVFVLLFVYMVIFTTQGSIVLTTDLRLPVAGRPTATADNSSGQPAYDVPGAGYQIVYNNIYYGLNSNGQVRLDLSLSEYIWALATRKVSVSVRPPGTHIYDLPIQFKGLGMESISLGQAAASQSLGALDYPWKFGAASPRRVGYSLSLVGSALADTVSGLRLYVQSVMVSNTFGTGEVKGTLTVGGASRPLLVLSDGLDSAAEGTLLVKGNVNLLQNYRAFFAVSTPPSDGSIRLQASQLLFGTTETYQLPAVSLGAQISVPGSGGGKLVVQLMHPIDVVFFERRDTASVTERLKPKLAEKGYVPRVNSNVATTAGEYNVIYSGDEVPNSALREVLAITSANGVRLRSIQSQRHLTNGIQNQIQVGSSQTAGCLPIIDQATITSLVRASEADFQAALSRLPAANCS
jgi:hypothetical protein